MAKVSLVNTVFVFDLDDTLYSEKDFVRSGISFVRRWLSGRSEVVNLPSLECLCINSAEWIEALMKIDEVRKITSKEELLELYRNHFPDISLRHCALDLLDLIKKKSAPIALITDGRSITQRNKLKSLNIAEYFDLIVISEEFGSQKPCLENFVEVQKRWPLMSYCYIADNTAKDFIAPKALGWTTIGLLDKGDNIHKQSLAVDEHKSPDIWVGTFEELILCHL
jgi:putative hydrolase of the HAD superfamily